MKSIGVLLMSLGTPNHLDEMEAYLLDIRGGRPLTPEFVNELKERYRKAGGRSPLLDITKAQAAKLEELLNKEKGNFKVYVGMRHWHPYIPTIMEQMAKDGVTEMISFPMTPFYSKLSFEAYHDKVRESQEKLKLPFEIVFAKSWHNHPLLIESHAELLKESLAKLEATPKVLFTAHSLPERILKDKDPYPDQLLESASLAAQKAGITDWEFAYQSQGGSREPWLGPKVEDKLDAYAAQAIRNVLIDPIGFVCDHMEILYDIDILFKGIAKEKGIRLTRTPSLNVHPTFIRAMAAVVLETVSVLR